VIVDSRFSIRECAFVSGVVGGRPTFIGRGAAGKVSVTSRVR
jgi:hypothetical protein